jgi:large subunit ribosomal protein L21
MAKTTRSFAQLAFDSIEIFTIITASKNTQEEIMFAIVKAGGKQHTVRSGDVIKINKIEGNEGDVVTFDEVLAANGKVGAPLLAKASVKATILQQGRDDKIIVFKKKRRQNYRRKNGHRQYITTLRITEIAA